jgi:MFS family permease
LTQDAASELLYPLLPLVITVVLGAPAAVVGIVEGLAEGAAALFKYLSGRSSDRVGRKPLVGTGYGLAAVGKVIVAAASVWPVLLVGRVVDRIGKGIRGAPRDAMLAEHVETPDLGKVFGFHRAADTLGAVIGPLIALAILAWTNDDIPLALWIAVIPAALSAFLVVFTRDDVSAAKQRRDPVARAAARERLPRRYVEVVTVLVLIALANFPDALILLRVSEIGFSATGVVAVYVVYNFVYAAISYPAGSLSDRWPRARVYALGLVCFAVGYIGLGLVDGGWLVFVLMAVYGGFNGFTDGVGKAWISSLVPSGVRGHAQGVFQGLSGGAVLVAGLWAGLSWTTGPGDGVVPLIVAGSIAALAAVWMLTVGRRLHEVSTAS